MASEDWRTTLNCVREMKLTTGDQNGGKPGKRKKNNSVNGGGHTSERGSGTGSGDKLKVTSHEPENSDRQEEESDEEESGGEESPREEESAKIGDNLEVNSTHTPRPSREPPLKRKPGRPKRDPTSTRQRKYPAMKIYPNKFVKLIDNLMEHQREWVRRSTFKTILDLKFTSVDRFFLLWLTKRWNGETREFKIRSDYIIQIDEEMIGWVFGLPFGDSCYVFEETRERKKQFEELKDSYGNYGGVVFPTVYNECLQANTDKSLFMRHFICYVLSVLICTTKTNYTRPELLKVLIDDYVQQSWKWNWSKYILDWMVNHGGGPNATGVEGCGIALMIIYLDRLNVGGRGVRWNVDTPRLGAWQQVDLDRAIKADRSPACDEEFGVAEVVRGVVYGRPYPIGGVYAKPKWLMGAEIDTPVELPDKMPENLPLQVPKQRVRKTCPAAVKEPGKHDSETKKRRKMVTRQKKRKMSEVEERQENTLREEGGQKQKQNEKASDNKTANNNNEKNNLEQNQNEMGNINNEEDTTNEKETRHDNSDEERPEENQIVQAGTKNPANEKAHVPPKLSGERQERITCLRDMDVQTNRDAKRIVVSIGNYTLTATDVHFMLKHFVNIDEKVMAAVARLVNEENIADADKTKEVYIVCPSALGNLLVEFSTGRPTKAAKLTQFVERLLALVRKDISWGIDMAKVSKFFLPFLYAGHWTLWIVAMKKNKLRMFDTRFDELPIRDVAHLAKFVRHIMKVVKGVGGEDVDMSKWSPIRSNSSIQRDDIDSGVYVIIKLLSQIFVTTGYMDDVTANRNAYLEWIADTLLHSKTNLFRNKQIRSYKEVKMCN